MVGTITTPDRLTLSVSEAAAELGVSERYMYGLLRRADCTFGFHLGRKIRIVRSEFERWIRDQAGLFFSP